MEDDGYIPYIGNLCLLTKKENSKASIKSFKEKRKIYEGSNLRHVQEIPEFATERRTLWATEAIDDRAEKVD